MTHSSGMSAMKQRNTSHGPARALVAGLLFALALPAHAGGIVAVDQAGYPTTARKQAVITAYADSFQVIAAGSHAVMYRGATAMASLGDPATGLELYLADFTAFSAPGTYLVRSSSGDTSAHFLIADSVYGAVARAALKGFFFQRCGTALLVQHAGVWNHPACHVATDAFFHATAESTGYALTTGGWHDAGDYGKYIVNAGVTVGTLLLAYDVAPSRFGYDDLGIPESGNGVPDILDEVRFELNWMLSMQAAGGGVFFKITKPQFEGFVMPQNDTGFRNIYRLSSTATGDFAAVMAQAARLYRPFDSVFADRCLAAAERAWDYLVAHPAIVPAGGFTNPSGTATGEYGDGNDSDERLWAAAELYRSRGDATTHAYVLSNYSANGIVNSEMAWPDVRALAQITYLRATNAGVNTSVQQNIRSSLHSFCAGVIALRDNSGFRTALSVNGYNWGCNSNVLNKAVLLLIGREAGGPAEWEAAALEQLHYILGTNVHALSFVTGIGSRSTLHPHHRPSGADGVTAPVPGLLAGGPNRNISQDPVLQSRFTSSTPAAYCYADDQGSYASNEIAINWNAPLVFVAGYFARPGGGASGVRPESSFPEEIRLGQNYPNPFNGTTVIPFTLAQTMDVELTVTDLLGRRVAFVPLGTRSPGVHQAVWHAGEGRISSGQYYYALSSGGRPVSAVRPLVLLR
jgi:endoglucanase